MSEVARLMEQSPLNRRPELGTPDVSVVISTHNRRDLLPEAIASVLAQEENSPPFELIVVDNDSTDGTREVVEELIARGDGRLRYLFEARKGLSYGRNAGVACARGRIVAFTDDDVRVAPDWVRSIVRALDAHPEVAFVGGKVLPRWPADPPRWLTPLHWSPLALADFGDEPRYVDRHNPACLVGASLAVRRELFDEFGGFDPAYQHDPGAVSAVEDHEFEQRLWRAGRRGLYAPEVVITAAVQPDRLEKRYHRRWHYDHGRMVARLECADRESAGASGDCEDGRLQLFGVPAWAIRRVVARLVAWVAATVLDRPALAFWHEGEMREAAGQIRYHFERHRRESHRRNLAAELGAFALALVRRWRSQHRLRPAS
jgi:glucosyl-dolichyl phosphate glucuronosyltransferase